jgi:tetratricopeptide (TPR) repeat protein
LTNGFLTELTRAHLVTEHAPGRFTFHDLLRAYAAHLAYVDDRIERHAATHRLLDHYLHAAHAADRLLEPQREAISLPPARPGVTPVSLDTLEQALSWLTSERAVLVRSVQHAADYGFGTHAWQLAVTLTSFLQRRGHWRDQAATHNIALTVARRLDDKTGQAHAHQGIARACFQLGDHDTAHAHAKQALDLHCQLGNSVGQARAHGSLSFALGKTGSLAQALYHTEQALDLFHTAGHKQGQAQMLNAIAWTHAQHGRYQQALTCCRQALRLHQELREPSEEANAWDSLGYTYHHLGRHQRAAHCYRHALNLFRQAGARYHEAETLTHLGDTRRARKDLAATRRLWQQALDILDELGHPDAHHVRAKLCTLGQPSRTPDDKGRRTTSDGALPKPLRQFTICSRPKASA